MALGAPCCSNAACSLSPSIGSCSPASRGLAVGDCFPRDISLFEAGFVEMTHGQELTRRRDQGLRLQLEEIECDSPEKGRLKFSVGPAVLAANHSCAGIVAQSGVWFAALPASWQ